jgi:hypothetical protein
MPKLLARNLAAPAFITAQSIFTPVTAQRKTTRALDQITFVNFSLALNCPCKELIARPAHKGKRRFFAKLDCRLVVRIDIKQGTN